MSNEKKEKASDEIEPVVLTMDMDTIPPPNGEPTQVDMKLPFDPSKPAEPPRTA